MIYSYRAGSNVKIFEYFPQSFRQYDSSRSWILKKKKFIAIKNKKIDNI